MTYMIDGEMKKKEGKNHLWSIFFIVLQIKSSYMIHKMLTAKLDLARQGSQPFDF